MAWAHDSVTFTYKGHVAYAATFPWEGMDALDTAVMPNTNIRVLQQQMKF